MNTPLVSVAMVTRNVERFLAEAIESILNQTLKELEFVIVDFGSTDRTKSIISSYQSKDPRIKFHEIPSCSLPLARNASCAFSTGRYIAIMDADDIALPERLACQLEFMEEHPDVGIVGASTQVIDHEGRELHKEHYPATDSEIRETLRSVCPFNNPTVFIRREIFEAAGGFRDVALNEDYDLFVRVAEHCNMANLQRILSLYRFHPRQVTRKRVREMTLCLFAVRAAADLRKRGQPDPLDSTTEITPELLARMGVSEAEWQPALVNRYRWAMATATDAGDYPSVLELAHEMLSFSDWKSAEKWEVAHVWFKSAQIHRRQGNYLQSGIATVRGILVRPVVLARPLKPLLRRVGKLLNLKENADVRRAS
jgi:glycosyltransferase involved in cell wall biosynthesis